MSDTTIGAAGRPHDWSSDAAQRRVKKRYRRDRILQLIGLTAIAVAILMIGILFASLTITGYSALSQSKVTIPVTLDADSFDREDPTSGNYRKVVRDGFASYFPDVEGSTEQRDLFKIMTSQADTVLREMVVSNPDLIGSSFEIAVPLSDPFDQLHKGVTPRQIDRLNSAQIAALTHLNNHRAGLVGGEEALRVEDGQTYARIDVPVTLAFVNPENPADIDIDRMLKAAVRDIYGGYPALDYSEIFEDKAREALAAYIDDNPNAMGETVTVDLPISDAFDQYHRTGEAPMLNPVFASERQLEYYDRLVDRGLVSQPVNWGLLTHADSRFPELAGLAGALAGSFFALLVCFLISFPVGIAAAVYLEEFAPRNRWTDLIEVNINNLAAVPSVVFGLLGLAVFIGFFGLPRSVPLVGGMVLSLMTLPTIIIATRAALKAVPPSIREAALGVGASKHQVVMHHVLPLAMPGILTGTIIGLAQALGETAPLLLIGMNAFIPAVDQVGILEPATSLPTQIYSWADSPERGFVARTSAAILVLLGFLVIMNGLAIFLRQKFQKKWS
ncbi:MAG: phosphate ABC transporter permease PstA [Dichotomicrobium sp.]